MVLVVVFRVRFAVAKQMLSKGGFVCTEGRGLYVFLRLLTPSEAEAVDRLPLNRDMSLCF